ncbi:MutS-related protein [Tunicatimonas pelagia]|uniref:MutS-related protein n=1 Tax=Tunicatimonas pelagia TaxID=931531 RepID=UPI002666DFE2|nr:DNA mismatch repair protein MutS [Tunicatimonas pelagia]WKN46089.1 DNA mismatch repair protein MutS [Tunicatimonas pelagia]
MKKSVEEIFQSRLSEFQQQAQILQKKYNQVSILRIVFFVVAIISIVYLANARLTDLFIIALVVSVVGFVLIIRWHQRIKQKYEHSERLSTINQEELHRLNYQLHSFDSGETYQDARHPYSGDLDVFGEHSLFQLINRSATRKGKDFLADWLRQPAAKPEIEARQAAVAELKDQLDWRQAQQAHGRQVDTTQEDIQQLLAWASSPPAVSNQKVYQIVQYAFSALAVLLIVAAFVLPTVQWYIPMIVILVNMAIVGTTAKAAEKVHQQTNKSVTTLQAYRYMMEGVEQQSFQSEKLQSLQNELKGDGKSASASIKELSYILSNFDARGNMMYHILNVIFLLDVHWLLRADRWKAQTKDHVEAWLNSMGEVEALDSIASFAYAQPDFTFPAISGERHYIRTEAMGHCLIPPQQRVSNDFAMQGRGTINIITGSNMSGKSTFLRTVGTNMVLALTGAPVCAQQFEVAVMQVFSSMRTQDSLEENVSSFYAELQRLRQLLTMLEAPQLPVLFMLDEILKGTNSHDRHHGAASLIKQLGKLVSSGFVSTHDLELGKLADELPNLRNYNFTSTIAGDEIIFDYKLHDGVCQSFNASKLMEKMGIAIGN